MAQHLGEYISALHLDAKPAETVDFTSLFKRIEDDLVEQQDALLGDLDPEVRAQTTEVLLRLARAAEARFVGSCATAACEPGSSTGVGCG